jgi:hypothetical protein
MKYILVAVLFFASTPFFAQQHLFKIIENNKVGYINQNGNVIIKPVYKSGTNFANGAAAVREDGLFGLIDTMGKYLTEPKYDYISEFTNGIAEAWLNDKTIIINSKGEKIFDYQYKSIEVIGKNTYKVQTKAGKWGVYNTLANKYIIDTLYNYIGDFNDGIAIANLRTEKEPEFFSSLIDSTGKTMLPIGQYVIENYVNGIARVVIKNQDKKYAAGDEGYVDLKGNIVFNDTLITYANEFSNNRAFTKNNEGKYTLIDTDFKKVGNLLYDDVLNDKFKDGYAIVKLDDFWGIIDTTGYLKVKPHFEEIDDVGLIGRYFFYSHYVDEQYYYGIATVDDQVVLQPIMQYFDRAGFNNGLLKAIINNRLTYIDTAGNIVWQQKIANVTMPIALNIDYKARGYFYAYQTEQKKDYNGWAESDNFPKRITKQPFVKNLLSIVIDTTQQSIFNSEYIGYKLYVANTTKNDEIFDAEDSRLGIVLQAQDKNGIWKDIEYLPHSWCGNSYHTLILKPKEYWEFTIPKYEGAIKTKIRAMFICRNGKIKKILYSNAIEASINPSQFRIEEVYHPI